MKKPTINILCVASDNYIQHAGVTLASLFENNKDIHFVVYLMTEYISAPSKEKLKGFVEFYDNEIIFIQDNFEIINTLPLTGNWSKLVYLKLFIPYYIPQTVKRLLIIDVDIIFNGSIRELLNIDMDKYALAGVEDYDASTDHKKRLGIPDDKSYVNGGFIYANMDKWRDAYKQNLFFSFLEKHKDHIICQEQDIINGVFQNEIYTLPIKWNMLSLFFAYRPRCFKKYLPQLEEAKKNPLVIHFCEMYKPWEKESFHPYRSLYFKYLKLTPWKDYKPTIRNWKSYVYIVITKLKYVIHKIGLLHGNTLFTPSKYK